MKQNTVGTLIANLGTTVSITKMKKFLPLVFLVALVSCSKESLIKPTASATAQLSATLSSYKDANVTIENFTAASINKEVSVSFKTVFANNIKSVEILRGVTTYTLCSIYKQDVSSINMANATFSTVDSEPANGQTLYYMVKYTLIDGDWAYTPVIALETETAEGGN